MQPSKLFCPHCGAVLRSNKTLVVGQAVECVKCSAPFTVSATDVSRAEAAVPAGLTSPTDDVPRMGVLAGASRPSARPMPQAQGTSVLTAMPAVPPRKPATALVALAALLVLFAAGATVAYRCFFDTPDKPEEIAQNRDHSV